MPGLVALYLATRHRLTSGVNALVMSESV